MAKSPISPTRAFPFNITSPGMSLLTDDDIELTGLDINTIRCQGLSWKDYIVGSISRIIFIGHMSSTFKSGALKRARIHHSLISVIDYDLL